MVEVSAAGPLSATSEPAAPERRTFLLVDGENIDATLGTSILGRKPRPDERPRWDRLLRWAEDLWRQDVTGLFFLAVNGELPMSFVQALLAMGWRPVPLSGDGSQKVVDIAIIRTMEALEERPGDVVLVSNDGDFVGGIEALLAGPDRRVGVVGFHEFRNHGFGELEAQGLLTFDLEYDVAAFRAQLPRVRVIPIDEFDPLDYL